MRRRSGLLASLLLPAAVAGAAVGAAPAAGAPSVKAPAGQPSAPAAAASEPAPGWLSAAASGAAQGVAQNVVKQAFLHPFDTVKTRLQTSPPVPQAELFEGLYRGFLPPLLAGTPGSAAFFAAKEAATSALSERGLPVPLPTLGGVTAGVLAAKAIRTPFDAAETKAMAGVRRADDSDFLGWDGSWAAVKSSLDKEGVLGLYRGYWANVAYKLPADAVKFVAYEGLRGSGAAAALPAGVAGAAATVVAQGATTPLDVVRTRVLVGERSEGLVDTARRLLTKDRDALWSGLNWRLARGVVSGAIQFTVLEWTKDFFAGKR